MTPSARLAAVIAILDDIIRSDRPSDQIMHAYLTKRRYIGSKDRKAVTTQVYTILRHYGRLAWWSIELGVPATGRTFLMMWLILGEHRDAMEIYDLFSGGEYAPTKLNHTEQNLVKKLQTKKLHPKQMPDGIKYECPPAYQHALQNAWGDDFATEMKALDAEAPLDIRINTLKASREDVFATLKADGFEIDLTPMSPLGLRVLNRPAFSAHELYKKGHFEIQDEGSQLLSILSGVQPKEWGVDLCAGAGGKTLALAAMMKNKGRLWACDVDARRLENSKLRIRRAGVDCVELQPLKDMKDPWLKRHNGKCDFVLVDAPCSGTGTWRRSPFSRWQDMGPTLPELTEMQLTAMNAAAPLLKKGGRLIYATCSLLPQENEKQVAKFLETHPDFKPVALSDMWKRSTDMPIPGKLDLSKHYIALTPAKHNTDGFFVGVMEKE
ncbi:MAG TPA: RsmB/NOP family class I SAM-dependent RNA methyltransferase [Alphaproteobacteria bacterium]